MTLKKDPVKLKDHKLSRRSFLTGSSALALAGWATVSGGWILRPKWAGAAGPIKMGIATDITGAISHAGNACWQTAQLAVKQRYECEFRIQRHLESFDDRSNGTPLEKPLRKSRGSSNKFNF